MICVGTIVKLITPCLENPAGTLGVCYEEYDIGDGHGVSIIFKNGNYDGFSPRDQSMFLEVVGYALDLSDYKFTNVMRLSKDYKEGKFNNIWICGK